jgi:hypothetical protein
MQATTLIIFLTYLVAGVLPPALAVYLFRVQFLGGAWAALAIGVIGGFVGGLVDTLLLDVIGDMLIVAGAVDIVPPLVVSILFTVTYGLISRSNRRNR